MKEQKTTRRINKKAAAALMALMLTTGTLAVPVGESGIFSAVPMNITVADAAQTTTYDLNSSATYKALTKAKVTALWKKYTAETVGTYREGFEGTYYKSGKAPSVTGGWYEGEITADTLKAIENSINIYRTLAGLSTITAQTGSTYQKGALVRSTPNNFAHVFTAANVKPAGMSQALWNEGKNCVNWILAEGSSPAGLGFTWVSEANNQSPQYPIGHRMTLLNPTYNTIYFGYSNGVALGYANTGTNKMKEAAATFPSAGYMPTEMVDWDSNAMWDVQLNPAKLRVSSLSNVKLTIKGGGKTYTRTAANGGLSFGAGGSFYGGTYLCYKAPDFVNGKALTGDYTVSVTGLTDTSGKPAALNYTIKFYNAGTDSSSAPKTIPISKCKIGLSQSSYKCDGKAKTPTVTVSDGTKRLVKGTDYTVSYKNNTNVGTATVTITGKGSYSGSTSKTFTIAKATKSINKCTYTLSHSTYTYDGKPKTPAITIKDGSKTLKKGVDYTVTYKNNTEVGSYAAVCVVGKGDYDGSFTVMFRIAKPQTDISKCSVTLAASEYYADGKAKTPAVTVKYGGKTLKKDKDYMLTYRDNVKAGKATVSISGMGDYKGSITRSFTITAPIAVKASDCKASICSYCAYTGKEVKPEFTVSYKGQQLVKGKDYDVTKYTDNIKCGKAYAHIKLKGKYSGAAKFGYTITKKTIVRAADCKVTKPKTITYKGSPVTPKLVLKYKGQALTEGKDYTVAFTNNNAKGTAKATFTLKGSYVGKVTLSFSIT